MDGLAVRACCKRAADVVIWANSDEGGRSMVESTSPQATIPAAPAEPDPALSAPATVAAAADDALLVEADLLVEEVSIDGMCGVY